MSAARIAGAVTAGVLGILLIVLLALSLGPESVVLPTVNVAADRAQYPTAVPDAQEILAARTRLLDDRTKTGAEAFPPESQGNASLVMRRGVPDAREIVQRWQNARPEGDLLRERGDIVGLSSLPYPNADRLQQPGGRTWRRLHNDQVRYGGSWAIIGVAFALALFLFARGRIKIAEGFSGEGIQRFNAIERANHWMTASAFILMGLTGLILLYGKPLLIPLIGGSAFGAVAWWSAWAHMAAAVPFVIGILVMIALWIRDNLPTRLDWEWLKRGGGFLRDDGNNPPARRFNAGQKLVFWAVVLGGLALTATGVILMFPFYWFGYDGMQSAQTAHAAIALLMVALILGHIYIGTVGMQGAFDAMWSGKVDRNWAKEHHRLWYSRLAGREADSAHPDAKAAGPAE